MPTTLTRPQAIRALLRSLLDYLPDAKTARYDSGPGETPDDRVTCPTCRGRGHFKRGTKPCARCEGGGTIAVSRDTGEQVGSADTVAITPTRYVNCDACGGEGKFGNGYGCESCRAAGSLRVPDSSSLDVTLRRLEANRVLREGGRVDDAFGWEVLRRRYRQAGSYAVLERALEQLRLNLPEHHRLVMAVEVYGQRQASAAEGPTLVEAILFIDRRMGPEIDVPRWVISPTPEREAAQVRAKGPGADPRAREDRNAEIRRLHGEGASRETLAARFDLGDRQVRRIVDTPGTVAA